MLSLTLAKFDKFSRISRSYASILNELKLAVILTTKITKIKRK